MPKPWVPPVPAGLRKPGRSVRVPAIEGLRGVAMCLVFFGHFEGLFRRYLPANGLSLRVIDFLRIIGHQGVCFFLVLSGYFVYQAYLSDPCSFFGFAARRVRRIYPPYVAMLGVYLVFSLVLPSESKIPPGHVLSYLAGNLLMVSSRPMIIQSWTIGTLLALYILAPLFWSLVRYQRWSPAWRIAFLLTAVAIWYSVPKPIPMLDQRVAFVFIGFALYEAISAGALGTTGEIPALGILGCGYVLWYANDRGWTGFLHLQTYWYYHACLAPGLFYVCRHVLANRGRIATCLERAALPRLGRMSYSYYLSHGMIVKGSMMLLVVLRPNLTPNPAIFWAILPLVFASTLIGAWAWFRLVEVPLAAWIAGGRQHRVEREQAALQPA